MSGCIIRRDVSEDEWVGADDADEEEDEEMWNSVEVEDFGEAGVSGEMQRV